MAESVLLKEKERIDSLLWCGLNIIQNPDWFCFGLDAVLLADFAEVQQGASVLDLCAGNGVIPLLLSAKEETAVITGIEFFPEVVEMAGRSVRLNGLSRRIKILVGDICNIKALVPSHCFQVVTANPPYRKVKEGRLSPSPLVAAAKAEVHCDLAQVVAAIADSLAPEGRFYLVYPYKRLRELLAALQRQSLQVTQLTLVKNFSGDVPFLCLVGGGYQEQVDNNLENLEQKEFIIFEKDRSYKPEMLAIFHKYEAAEKR